MLPYSSLSDRLNASMAHGQCAQLLYCSTVCDREPGTLLSLLQAQCNEQQWEMPHIHPPFHLEFVHLAALLSGNSAPNPSSLWAWHSLPLVPGVGSCVFSPGFDHHQLSGNGFHQACVVVFSRLSWWGPGAVRTWLSLPRSCDYFLRSNFSSSKVQSTSSSTLSTLMPTDVCESRPNVWTHGVITFLQCLARCKHFGQSQERTCSLESSHQKAPWGFSLLLAPWG